MPSATAKRSRRAAFDEDDEDDGATVLQASSSLKNEAHRKKARMSNDASRSKTTQTSRQESNDGSEDEVMEDPEVPSATQYETMRDAGFRHLENTEIDDQQATQRLKNRPQVLGENQVALNAILESITCINFMCHERLHVQLGPLLNFIVGENGSGKSAILTAITLCLGGKASATNRGGSLRAFVKEDAEHANLSVKIKNQGPDAYKPHEFGDSIIVERHFNKSGSSGFKLKSATGRTMSTKKSDVDEVIEYYCLQVDNPLNVLSQDNARQFLNASKPEDKYKYFVQGTQLEQLDQDYELLQEILDSNETRLEAFQENIAFLKQKSEKAVQLRDAAAKSVEMRKQLKVFTKQLAWAQVLEQENILKERENAIHAAQTEIARAEETIVEKTEILETIDKKIEDAEESLNHLGQEEGQFKEQEEEALNKYNSSRKAVEDLHKQERDMYTNLGNADDRVKDYEKKIQEEERRLEEANGGALATKEKELKDAKLAAEGIKESQKSHAENRPALVSKSKEAEKKWLDSEELVKQKNQEVTEAERKLQNSSRNRTDPYAGFDSKIPSLLKRIENDTGFTQKPIGPIGTFVQLTKPEWSSILEKIFGGALNGFIVASKADQSRLLGHMEQLRVQNCQIFISPRNPLSNLREPDERFDTILRVLKIDDVRVRDLLVINNSIEQIILIKSREEGERVIIDGRPPEHVSACLSFHDQKRGEGLRLTNRGGNLSSSPVYAYKGASRMKSGDQESQIAYLKESLQQLRAEYRQLDLSRRQLQQASQHCKKALTQHKKQADDLDKELRNAEVRIDRIEVELDKFEGADNKLRGYRNDLNEAKEQKDHYGNQYGDLSVQKQELNKEVDALFDERRKTKLALKDHQAKITKAEDKVRRYKDTRKAAVVEKNQAYEHLDLAKVGKADAEKAKEDQLEVVATYTKHASDVSADRVYVPEGDTYSSIESKFNAVRDQMQKLRKQVGADDEVIQRRALETLQEYKEAKKNHKDLVALVEELKNAMMDRLKKWRTFQRLISAHARTNFSYLLSERGYRGELLLDHKKKKLRIQVEPDETRQTSSGRNTKTLSGGEKSFSSICLLLAIWDAMGSPLRCLDEFDVFMDNVNRAISTNMLIATARRSVGKQFILITPNAIEGRANIDKDVKIIRLTDPRQRLLADH